MHLRRRPRRNRKLLLAGLVVDPSSREDRLPRATDLGVKFHRLAAGVLGLLEQSRLLIGRGRDPHRGRAPAGAVDRGASQHCALLAKVCSSNPSRKRLAPEVRPNPSAATSKQTEAHRSSAFPFLEEVAILSSRACLFEQTSRDLAALMGANRMLRQSLRIGPTHEKKNVGRPRAVPLHEDPVS
jgi:hypothetical protein